MPDGKNPPGYHPPRDDNNEQRVGPGGWPGLGGPNVPNKHDDTKNGNRDPYRTRPGSRQNPEEKRNPTPYKHKPSSKPKSAADEIMDQGMGRGKGKGSKGLSSAPAKNGGCAVVILAGTAGVWAAIEIISRVVA